MVLRYFSYVADSDNDTIKEAEVGVTEEFSLSSVLSLWKNCFTTDLVF